MILKSSLNLFVNPDCFMMSEFGLCESDDGESPRESTSPSSILPPVDSQPYVGGGKGWKLTDTESQQQSTADSTRPSTRAPTRAAAVAAAAAWNGSRGDDDGDDESSQAKSGVNGGGAQPAVVSSSRQPPARKAAPAAAPKKQKLQPSGFAGISAIATDGPGGLLTTVRHEPQQGAKKRRRRPDPRAMSDEMRIERRERNREHAKRSRIRKKFLLESLQQQLCGLRGENTGLREIVKRDLPASDAQGVLSTCLSEETFQLLDSDMRLAAEETSGRGGVAAAKVGMGSAGSGGGGGAASLVSLANLGGANGGGATAGGAQQQLDCSRGLPEGVGGQERALTEPDYRLMSSLMHCQQNFTVSDPSLPDNPIVYASEGFLVLTGYTRDQVLGRNCRFLQGPKTDQRMVDVIRRGVAKGEDTSVCLLNYKQDGTPFWNQFFVAALRDARGNIVNFVGVQCEVNQETANQASKEAPTLPEFYGGEDALRRV
jgi:PAS domain S-box-containing protein